MWKIKRIIKLIALTNENISSFFDKMSKQAHCEELLAKAIFTSGIPLNFVENEYWLQFLATLRPKFESPSRAHISNRLLDNVDNDIKKKVTEKMNKADSIIIQCDSYTNVANEGITNIVLNTPDPVFFKTIENKSNSQTGEYLDDKIVDIINEIGPKCWEYALITQHTVKKSGKLLKKNIKKM